MNKHHFKARHLLLWIAGLMFAHFCGPAIAAQTNDANAAPNEASSYKLNIRDQIEIQIFDEPDLTSTQRIDGRGQIRVPLVGTVAIVGKTAREAEDYIEALYVEKRILKNPMATVRVLEYAPREVNVLGEVANPGALPFPPEINEMDIVDVISKAGGFTQIAQRKSVEVTRIVAGGKSQMFEINVEDMIRGRDRDARRFMVLPGDTISVPQKLF